MQGLRRVCQEGLDTALSDRILVVGLGLMCCAWAVAVSPATGAEGNGGRRRPTVMHEPYPIAVGRPDAATVVASGGGLFV